MGLGSGDVDVVSGVESEASRAAENEARGIGVGDFDREGPSGLERGQVEGAERYELRGVVAGRGDMVGPVDMGGVGGDGAKNIEAGHCGAGGWVESEAGRGEEEVFR